MAYLFKLTDSEYQLVIMANGKIYANEDSSYMFWNIGLNNSDGFQYLDTSRVKNMEGMFGHKTELEGNLTIGYQVTFSLDLRSFDTSNVTNMAVMFYNRKNLKQILVGPLWNTDNVVNSRQMFYRNEILAGERGTNYDSSHSDKEYARLDKEGSPGYFSSRYIQEY